MLVGRLWDPKYAKYGENEINFEKIFSKKQNQRSNPFCRCQDDKRPVTTDELVPNRIF